jgi:hypothetical protein
MLRYTAKYSRVYDECTYLSRELVLSTIVDREPSCHLKLERLLRITGYSEWSGVELVNVYVTHTRAELTASTLVVASDFLQPRPYETFPAINFAKETKSITYIWN